MRTSKPESLREKHLREAGDFTKGWSWDRFLDDWRERLDDFGVDTHPIFRDVTARDPASSGQREPALSWWPNKDFDSLRANIHQHFERYPGTVGPVHPQQNMRRGEIETLEHLWAVKDDADKVAAVLISASLFSRFESGRGPKPEKWPHWLSVESLQEWAYACWREHGRRRGWHYACTSVLPYESQDYVYTIDSMDALVRYIAEEHAALLLKYRPVVINFVADSKPALRAI